MLSKLTRNMDHETLEKLSIISLKARVLREWQKASRGRVDEIGSREILSLELLKDFPSTTEKTICRVFGMHYSSASLLVKKLVTLGLFEKSSKQGERLKLTKLGAEKVAEARNANAARMRHWFSDLDDADWTALDRVATKIEKAVTGQILEGVFDSPGDFATGVSPAKK